jgi:hypothetical protein
MKVSIVLIGISIMVVQSIIGFAYLTIPPACNNSTGICTPYPEAYFFVYPIQFIIVFTIGIVVAIFGYAYGKSSSPENDHNVKSEQNQMKN